MKDAILLHEVMALAWMMFQPCFEAILVGFLERQDFSFDEQTADRDVAVSALAVEGYPHRRSAIRTVGEHSALPIPARG